MRRNNAGHHKVKVRDAAVSENSKETSQIEDIVHKIRNINLGNNDIFLLKSLYLLYFTLQY